MNNEHPLVSVLMTAYNREKYIAEAIKSVLASTYTNFELIIVDDYSSDKTVVIAESYAEKDNRVKLFVNEKNLGDYPNRNKAASYAHGKYLKYVDADDLIYPWGLELLIRMMQQYPEAGWGLCSLEQNVNHPFPFLLSPGDVLRYHYFGPGLFYNGPLSSIIRANSFNNIGGFTGRQHVGDHEMWHLLSLKYPVVLMPPGIVWYRVHSEQQMEANRTNPRVSFKYLCGAYQFFKYQKNLPLDAEEIHKIEKMLKIKIDHFILKKVLKLNWFIVKDLFKMKRERQYCYGTDLNHENI